jgi:hypothetical protein
MECWRSNRNFTRINQFERIGNDVARLSIPGFPSILGESDLHPLHTMSLLAVLTVISTSVRAEAPEPDAARDTLSPVYDWKAFPYQWPEIRAGKFNLMPVHWRRFDGNPVISRGMNCRPVMWDESTVRVFYGVRGKGQGIYYFDVDPQKPEKLKAAPTGPIIPTGTSGSYDDDWLNSPDPVRLSQTHLRMYYAAKRSGGSFFKGVWSLACADSHDGGHTWTKYKGNPILTTTGDEWESGAVGFASVECTGDGWKMWYLGTNQQSNAVKQVGYATSDDGLDWRRHAGNPVLPVDPDNRWESGAIAVPRVIRDDRLYRVWYCCYPQNDTYAIGCAESYDGIHWSRSPHNPVLRGSGMGWDSGMTAYPGVVRVGEQYLMWYSGNGYGSQGIGLATAEVPRGDWCYRTGPTASPNVKWQRWEHLSGDPPPREGFIQFAVVAQ